MSVSTDETVALFGLDEKEIQARRNIKRAQMQQWENISG